jgi:hypothetical protein
VVHFFGGVVRRGLSVVIFDLSNVPLKLSVSPRPRSSSSTLSIVILDLSVAVLDLSVVILGLDPRTQARPSETGWLGR